jgi:ATP-dependent RNA helicase RhlE
MSFESFHLHDSIMSGLKDLGYNEPTPIQEQAVPYILEGKDLIGLAQTGTGKTAAFALPILNRLMSGPRQVVRALVVSPTRELAEQTHQSFSELGKNTGLRSAAIYGGVEPGIQNGILKGRPEIIVACPGRLLDNLWQGTIDLSALEVLVIDEADRMFDMGFQPDIRSILQCITNPRQTLLFSATMPDDIRTLVKEVLHDPVTVKIGDARPAYTVAHTLYPVSPSRKTALVKELLRKTKTDSVLIFTRTKHGAEKLALQLKQSGYSVVALQGNMSQIERQYSMDKFREGKAKILVATDIAARGLDVLSISHVINYDMPGSVEDYTHRIGRTGRIGNTGEAYTLITREDNVMVRDIEKLLNTTIEKRTVEGFDYGAPEEKSVPGRGPRRQVNRNRAPGRQRPAVFSGPRRKLAGA